MTTLIDYNDDYRADSKYSKPRPDGRLSGQLHRRSDRSRRLALGRDQRTL